MLDPLAKIYGCTERAIEACDSALDNVIPTDAEEFHSPDNAEARCQLTRARSAAVAIREHLEANYEFIDGRAESREVTDVTH
jgi:hypothetical protein